MVGTTHVNNGSQVYYLGTGTSFNVSHIPGYQNLTADNFIVGACSMSASGGGRCPYRDDISMGVSGNGSISKSYNASTGALTISGVRGHASVNHGGPDAYFNLTYFAYLVKGKIKNA